jgi:YYY domain-containing protein
LLGALLLGFRGFWRWQGALVAVGLFALMSGLGLLLYLPFFTHYQALYVGVGLVRASTPLEPFLTIWGLFIFLAVGLLWAKVVWGRPRETPLRCLGLLLRRGARLPRLLDRHRLLVRAPRAGYTTGLLVLMGTAFLCVALMVFEMWVLALLVPLLILFGLLVLRRQASVEDDFLALLAFLAMGILVGCEVVFMKDFLQGGEYYRMNTIFKFYTQAWVLLAVATGASLPLVWRWFSAVKRPWWRRAWQALCLFLLLSSTVFLFLGTWRRVDDRFPGPRPPLGTLDGSAFMTVGSYYWPDESNRIQLVYDHQAIDWFLENVKGTPVVAEAPLPYYREFGLKVASYTGLPTLLGAHQNEQRYDWQVGPRSDDANNLYQTADLEEARQLISKLHVTYIYVGQLERTIYPSEGLAKFEVLRAGGEFALAYENPGVRVYEVLAR